MTKPLNYKFVIGAVLLVLLVGLGLVMYFTSGSKSDSKSKSDSNQSKSEDKRNPSPPNPSPPNPSSSSNCFTPPERQFECAEITGDDPIVNEFKCLPWLFKNKKFNQSSIESPCALLDSAISQRDECSKASQDLYNMYCVGNDPIIHNHNSDRNNYPCGQDCRSPDIDNCYKDVLIRN